MGGGRQAVWKQGRLVHREAAAFYGINENSAFAVGRSVQIVVLTSFSWLSIGIIPTPTHTHEHFNGPTRVTALLIVETQSL